MEGGETSSVLASVVTVIVAVLGAIVAAGRFVAGVRDDSREAKAATEDHGPRITTLEQARAVTDDRWAALHHRLDRMEAKIDRITERQE